MVTRLLTRFGLISMLALVTAGCSLREEETTPTPGNVFVIVTPTPGTPPPVNSAADRPSTYVVRPGDNLSDIADELGVTMRALQEANEIDDPNSIFAGQVLVVPSPVP